LAKYAGKKNYEATVFELAKESLKNPDPQVREIALDTLAKYIDTQKHTAEIFDIVNKIAQEPVNVTGNEWLDQEIKNIHDKALEMLKEIKEGKIQTKSSN
jgi:HEAT repeat protein